MKKPTLPKSKQPDNAAEQEVTSYFLLEQRRRQLDDDKGNISDAYPKLPRNSPWASDPVGPEPLIDRREDADFIPPSGDN
jgi:hypothetical protein